jgi:multidrug efflux system membrane fusion protein
VAVQVVKTGVTDGDEVLILSGLQPGDRVVVDGADRLRAGAKVTVAPDSGDPAATPNAGPGAAPGQQPANATPVPGQKHHHHHKPKTDQGQTGSDQ